MGQRNQFQSRGAIQAPSAAQMGQRGHSVGQGQVQGSQAMTSSQVGQMTRPDPDTLPEYPRWSRLVESHCTISRECTKGPHLKEK